MPKRVRECIDCGKEYDPDEPGKPGRITQCAECGSRVEVERVKGVTTFDSKDDRNLQLVSKREFDELKRQRRCSSPLYQGW